MAWFGCCCLLTTDWETDTFHIDRKLQVNMSAHPAGTVTLSVHSPSELRLCLLTRSQHYTVPCHRQLRHLDNTSALCGSNADLAHGHNNRQSRRRWVPTGPHDLVMCRLSHPRHPSKLVSFYEPFYRLASARSPPDKRSISA